MHAGTVKKLLIAASCFMPKPGTTFVGKELRHLIDSRFHKMPQQSQSTGSLMNSLQVATDATRAVHHFIKQATGPQPYREN